MPTAFLLHADGSAFSSFWEKLQPDVIHVHSLMGLPPVAIESAVEKHIKTVFTTHDYFGLCCRPDRIDYQGKTVIGIYGMNVGNVVQRLMDFPVCIWSRPVYLQN